MSKMRIDECIENEALVLSISRRSISDSADLWLKEESRYHMRAEFPFCNEPLFPHELQEAPAYNPLDGLKAENVGAPGSSDRIDYLRTFYSLERALESEDSPFA